MERDVAYNIFEKLAEKYGMSLEKAKETCQSMVHAAQDIGLDYQFDSLILTNTFDAHRLAMFAKKLGLMQEMTGRILRAYYTESKHIGDRITLIELAEEVGLNPGAVADMLGSTAMSEMVRADEREADEHSIRSIPYFLINKKHSITGAQPTEVFVKSLKQIIEKE